MFSRNLWTIILSVLLLTPDNMRADVKDMNLLVQNFILTTINNTANPCDDFYAYACGNYAQFHQFNNYQEMTSLMDLQYNNIILKIIDVLYLFRPYQQTCQTFVGKARNYVKACRQESKRNLTRYFEDIKPGPQLNWPILEKPSRWRGEGSFDIWTLLGKLHSYGLNNVLINQEIWLDKCGKYKITLKPANYMNNTTLAQFEILATLLQFLGVTNYQEVINDLKETDKLLIDILNYVAKDDIELGTTYGSLKLLYPKLHLNLFLQELLDNTKLTADTTILLKNPKYFQYLNDNMWQSLPTARWCNYLMMQFLYYLAVDSTEEFNGLDCVKDLRNKMDLAVNFLYYQHIYVQKAKLYNAAVREIYENIKNKFSKLFMRNRLQLTIAQVQFLLDKLKNVRLNIGNLPEGVTMTIVEKFYENVPNLDKNNYYKNHLHLLKHRFDKSLYYEPQQSYFFEKGNDVNTAAFYVAEYNMIVLPFGSLAFPLFHDQYYDVYKYSLLGFILAHELAHAFDTNGLNFNGMGEKLFAASSDILANKRFQKSRECLQSQLYCNNINECMADIVGIDVVYQIYADRHKFENRNYHQFHQLKHVYLNLAQLFCGKNDIAFIDHDTDDQRLNQIVMSSEGFAHAFHCDRNSKMNPRNRCRLY